ncbi:hypothetical protein J2D73_19205 [Acetobacter sacchari]|uniref:Uncharacterized protein n=1 Tax=Acetobacter sacchari TaxID=2661687 RepID=A0ABS3M165_9PROT|nr:hypothetical protein [Acetobacter sacchari]MBO1361914.1 hypothetical protein [Acetobacter sacchari]
MSGNINTPFIGNRLCNADGTLTQQGQVFVMSLWQRTGGATGVDASTLNVDVQSAEALAATANANAAAASSNAAQAQGQAATAILSANNAQTTAAQAEQDAQTALSNAQDVLIVTMLTSSAQVAKTAQSLDDAAAFAALSQIWPSQLLQSSQA